MCRVVNWMTVAVSGTNVALLAADQAAAKIGGSKSDVDYGDRLELLARSG